MEPNIDIDVKEGPHINKIVVKIEPRLNLCDAINSSPIKSEYGSTLDLEEIKKENSQPDDNQYINSNIKQSSVDLTENSDTHSSIQSDFQTTSMPGDGTGKLFS